MRGKNISDIIEQYLKRILANDRQIEISRSAIANLFNVVPSQINYVIKTRFTISNGYLVNSKRGGGGYIRIEKVKLLNNLGILNLLMDTIGSRLSQKDGFTIVKTLYRNDFLNHKEANLILATISKRTLHLGSTDLENEVRARIVVTVLNHLRFAS